MTIRENEFKELIKEPNADIEKFTIVSNDGKNLLTRIPKEIVDFLKIEKSYKIRWLVKSNDKTKINLEIIKE